MPAFLLNPRNWLYAVLLALMCWGGKQLYDFVHDRGMAAQLKIDQPIIDKANGERDEAVRVKDDYVGKYNAFVDQAKRDRETAAALAAAERDRIQSELDKARQSLAYKERSINELEDKLDQNLAQLRMPGLVVRLWNESLEGSATDPGVLGTALAGSTVGNDAAATEVTLLDLLTAGLRNNAQGVQRGMSLQEWRRYYSKNKAAFDAHEAKMVEGIDNAKPDSTGR